MHPQMSVWKQEWAHIGPKPKGFSPLQFLSKVSVSKQWKVSCREWE